MPLGLRIEGSCISSTEDEEIALDESYGVVPIAELLGVPLRAKQLAARSTVGDPEKVASASGISRLMVDPSTGFAPENWRSGGTHGPLPEVALVRSDGLPFTAVDWVALDSYLTAASDLAEAAHRRGRQPPPDQFTPAAFKMHLAKTLSVALQNRQASTAFLDLLPEVGFRFPKGSKVKATGLSKTELNGVAGVVTGRYDEEKRRVGVDFPEPHGVLSIRACNLVPAESQEEYSKRMLAEYDLG